MASFTVHHCWPEQEFDDYNKFRKLVGPKGESGMIRSLIKEWLRKQEGKPPEPEQKQELKMFSTRKDVTRFAETCSSQECNRYEDFGDLVNKVFKEVGKEKRRVEMFNKPTLYERSLRQVDTSNLESK